MPTKKPAPLPEPLRDLQPVVNALAKLPPAYRMIVILREMEGLSTREVAEVTRMSEDNVKTRLHRARVMLRESLEAAR